jgi:hypothetical protein
MGPARNTFSVHVRFRTYRTYLTYRTPKKKCIRQISHFVTDDPSLLTDFRDGNSHTRHTSVTFQHTFSAERRGIFSCVAIRTLTHTLAQSKRQKQRCVEHCYVCSLL